MALSEGYLQEIEGRLAQHSPAVVEALHEAVAALPPGLSDERLQRWLEEGVELAGHSLRSWEACTEYLRAGPKLLPVLDDAAFEQWVTAGRNLAGLGAPIAQAYFAVSPDVLPRIAGPEVAEWAHIGQRLYRATWKSITLAAEFFRLTPELLIGFSIPELGRLGRVLEGVSDRSADLAATCLEATPRLVLELSHAERLAFIDFASAISDASWPEASLYFQRGLDLLRNIEPSERAHYLELATNVARRLGRQAYNLFSEGAIAFAQVPGVYHRVFIDLAGTLVGLSPVAAMSMLRCAPTLSARLRVPEIAVWHAAGLEILGQTPEGGEAYFRLESGKAEQMIRDLSARIDLLAVSDLLRLYSKALTGTNVAVQPVAALEQKGIGWVSERGASTEGTSIYLPDHIDEYETKPENFAVFKVYATHQTAHLEFGSFDFEFHRPAAVVASHREELEAKRRAEGAIEKTTWLTDMERFFDLFPERLIASDLFTIVEDLRIDARIRDEYSGIRVASRHVQSNELQRRPDIRALPLREAFVENLVRASLDGAMFMEWPKPLEPLLFNAIHNLDFVRALAANVEDAADVTIYLYDIAMQIPNLPPELLQDLDWNTMTEEQLQNLEQQAGDMQSGLDELPDGEEEPYESPDQVGFRGDFKPELVQLLKRMRSDEQNDSEELSPLTADQIKDLLEKSVEIDVDLEDEFDMSAFNQLMENLQQEATAEPSDDDAPEGEEPPPPALSPEVKTFYYDEWDFRAADYRPRWCAVHERRIDEGTEEFYAKTLVEHAGLINETQRQFEMLKPETFRKIKRLEDGEDIDLDAALEFLVQKRAGHGDTQKIYWRRNKVERDVAVAFLLDMSASTDEEIEKRRPRQDPLLDSTDLRRYSQTLAQNRGSFAEPPKRIIDLEKESIVLLTRALETIGDRYGIYGFSGYGRENVEYYVIKDLNEPFTDSVRRRIDKVNPIRSTRMGPAIRHTTAKLLESDARARILFLVSDGRPQDHGYGRDRTEKEYAINDTHKALVEAKHKGITPFALTVDKEGHDYLGQMAGDLAYEVLGDIELLPSRLPTLYRRLTE